VRVLRHRSGSLNAARIDAKGGVRLLSPVLRPADKDLPIGRAPPARLTTCLPSEVERSRHPTLLAQMTIKRRQGLLCISSVMLQMDDWWPTAAATPC
jgi:hypothetical protein